MFRLFRNLRIQTINKGKIKKYLIYAIGEIILVVIGILLALQINTLNENRKIRNDEKIALNLIKKNLKTEISNLDDRITQFQLDIKYLSRVYEKQWDGIPLDSLGYIGTHFFYYKPINTGYEGLKSNGKLSIIQNTILNEKIIFYFENTSKDLLDISYWHRNFVTNYLEPYMFTKLPLNPREEIYDIKILKKKLETIELNSLISNQIGSLSRTIISINDSKYYANEIIELIDKEFLDRWNN